MAYDSDVAPLVVSRFFIGPAQGDPRVHMNTRRFDFPTWFTSMSGWSFYCALISTFGITGYYSDILRHRIPDWLAVGIFILPIIILVFIQYGEAPNRAVAISHIIAATWFMLLAVGMEIGHLLGYEPKGFTLYRCLAHIGWTFAWIGVYRRARGRIAGR